MAVIVAPHEEEEESSASAALVVSRICEIYDSISKLPSLKPCKDVDTLFTDLVLTCIPPVAIDVSKLDTEVQSTRSKLIRLCARAESLLETHYSTLLGDSDGDGDSNPLDRLAVFPYYTNYLKLTLLEHTLLSSHLAAGRAPSRVAFVGSGPLPLTSIVLARDHLRDPNTVFHNYDLDPAANALASRLVAGDPDLSARMVFHTSDIMGVAAPLREYDVVFLAALVGMDKEEKGRVLDHLGEHMAPGAVLMLRSAAGARAFLYPVVDPDDLMGRFEVLSVYDPTDEVINSVIVAKKVVQTPATTDQQGGVPHGAIMLPCKCCSKMEGFNPLNHGGGGMMEELVLEEKAS